MSVSASNRPFAVDTLLGKPSSASSSGRSIDLSMTGRTGLVRRRRRYRVYLPAGYDETERLPVVVVLHGCKQTHLDMQSISGFDAIADRERFIVVYPFITSHPVWRFRNCWGWWIPRQRTRGRGEIADIQQMVATVVADFAADPTRLHICGLSAGAAMSVIALATHSDVWRSGASVAGVPYGESARAVKYARSVPVRYKPIATLRLLLQRVLRGDAPDLLVIQSEADRLVDVALSRNLVEIWRQTCRLHDRPDRFEMGSTQQVPWRFAHYPDDKGHLRLGYLTVENLEHGWIGGQPGPYSMPEGPNISELIWAFFSKDREIPGGS